MIDADVLAKGAGRPMALVSQLARTIFAISERANRTLFDSNVVIGTDIGVMRQENQDRLVVARINRASGDTLAIAALSDGMGGMVDGAACATITIAAFIAELCTDGNGELVNALDRAAAAANDSVFSEYKGKGGATLSVVAWDQRGRIYTLNVGDSRIYHLVEGDRRVERITTDDTLKDAFGGEGNDLIQFIGIGRGLKPHITLGPPNGTYVLTTDGIHFIDETTLYTLLFNASTSKSKVERAIALARWLGGPDNATIAAINFDRLNLGSPPSNTPLLEVYPCGSDTLNIWNLPRADSRITTPPPPSPTPDPPSQEKTSAKPAKKRTRQKKGAKKIDQNESEQLSIEIAISEDPDADSEQI